jgi:hypothetical protein
VGSVPHCVYLLHYVGQCTPEKERNVMKYTASSLTVSLQSEENNASSALYYKTIMTKIEYDLLEMVNTYFSQAEKDSFFRFCEAIGWSQFSHGGIHSEKLHP